MNAHRYRWIALPLLGAALTLHGISLPTSAQFRAPGNSAKTGLELGESGGRIIVTETSQGEIANAGSIFTLSYPADSPAVKAVNAALAAPAGSAPADFEIGFSIEELKRSDRPVSADFRVRLAGGLSPRPWALAHEVDLLALTLPPGKPVRLDGANTPAFRFRVEPSGGKQRIDRLELVFSIRVDANSTPESYSLGDFTFRQLPAVAAKGKRTADFVNYAPASPMLSALESLGFKTAADGKAGDMLFLAGPFRNRETVQRYLDAVKAGKTVFIDLRGGEAVPDEVAQLLPVNPWTVKTPRLRRMSTPVTRFDAKPHDALFHGGPYDLHLPGTPMENSMMRYLWSDYEKPLDNTDWNILLATNTGMPLLVSGMVGTAKVYVFGGDSEDAEFVASPGYAGFVRDLVSQMAAPRETAEKEDADKLALSIERHQPGELALTVKNNSGGNVEARVAFQLSNWNREILNKATIPVSLAAGEEKRVILPKRGSWKGDSAIAESGSAIPYLRLRAAILSADRKKLYAERSAILFTGPELALSITEDAASWPDRKNMAQTDGEFDGTHTMLFTRPAGSQPEITVEVANRLAPMQPLAAVTDEEEKDNPTAEGLNDLSLSRADARQKGKWSGGWSATKGGNRHLTLLWEQPVVLGAYMLEGFGTYRNEDQFNARNFALKSSNAALAEAKNVAYKEDGSDYYVRCGGDFAPRSVDTLTLELPGVQGNRKSNLFQSGTVAAIRELTLLGWPEPGGNTVAGTLEVSAVDPATGRRTPVLSQKLSVKPNSREAVKVKLPARDGFGPLRYEIAFKTDDGKVLAETHRDVLYLAPGGKPIFDKEVLAEYHPGLLCTPGWYQYDSFGLGMVDWTRGWGGPHDKIWALCQGLLETGYRTAPAPDRMLTTDTRNSHYTNPWRFLPDGSYGWDLTADRILAEGLRRYPNDKAIYVFGSDRWNGIQVNSGFGWDMYVRFDQYLRKTTGKGLTGRSERAIGEEIVRHHADAWQKWQMEQYADKIDATVKRYADKGRTFYFETHGSFPLAGGELGERLGKTHVGVGTDLFWELRDQDLYGTLGSRFGVVAANPDLRSGLYKQWGWVNTESNPFWFANNSSSEPARRQWYSTYQIGRVDSEGKFLPYHVMGYSLQGGISTKFYPNEIADYARAFRFGTQVRPEQAAGFGLAVSWKAHERRMSPGSTTFGFGLLAPGGAANQIDFRMGRLYQRLVKQGVPVGFVTSSHSLRNWNGKNPLILADAGDWDADELAEIARLADAGTPVIAFAGDAPPPEFFRKNAETVDAGGVKLLRRGNLLYCPWKAEELPAPAVEPLVNALMRHAGIVLNSTTRMPVTPFVNSGALFLAFGSIADFNRVETVTVKPESLLPGLTDPVFLDLDRNERIDAVKNADGSYTFQLPAAACDGRMVMIENAK